MQIRFPWTWNRLSRNFQINPSKTLVSKSIKNNMLENCLSGFVCRIKFDFEAQPRRKNSKQKKNLFTSVVNIRWSDNFDWRIFDFFPHEWKSSFNSVIIHTGDSWSNFLSLPQRRVVNYRKLFSFFFARFDEKKIYCPEWIAVLFDSQQPRR